MTGEKLINEKKVMVNRCADNKIVELGFPWLSIIIPICNAEIINRELGDKWSANTAE